MSEKTQLTRITVPAITDARYIEGLSDAFNKINDNFKKIASLPFLQGVQGDSYQLEEYKIWNDDWTITEDGKVLLDSIFGKDVTVDGVVFDSIRDYIGEKLDGVSPLDFFLTEDGNTIVNNALYFYVIKDDTGNVIEKQLGQYYYFVDGRLKNIGNVYNGEISGVSLDGFNDYTGFYQYRYNPKSYNQKYLKVEILPSIYYDQDKNDICWKFNGNETGISAIGVKGADGKDADLLIVKATANESDCVGTVEAIINPIGANNSTEQWIDNPEDFKEGKALICIQRSGIAQDFAYGQVIKVNGVFNAYWEPNYVFSKLIGDNRITNYFYNMGGQDETATAPFYLAIPSYSDRSPSGDTELKKCAHVIDGKNISDGSNLRIFYSEKVFDENGNQQWNPIPTDDSVGTAGTLDIENYNVNIGKQLRVLSGAHISGSLGVKDGLQLHTGQLTVSENVQISGSLGVDNRITVGYGGDDSINIATGALVVSGGIGVSKSVNIGKNLTIEESLKVKGNSGATNERNADVVIYGGVGINKDVIIGNNGKMKIKNRGVVYKSDNTIKIDDAALNVNGDIYSDENIIAKNKSESYFSVLTGANDSNIARGLSGLQALVEANNEGTIFSGGGTQAAIGSTNGLNRTVYNRTALQSYYTKLKNSSKSYEPLEYHINPCGGQVLVNKYAGHGGSGKTLSASNALVVDGGLYARTKKPTSVVDKGDANGLSNVLIGHNDPGNSQFEDFPKDLDKGGYPLVIKSLKSDGSDGGGAMVFGIGDIYALSGNNTTGYSAGTLCLNHRTRYRGDVQIGRNLNIGDNTLGGNVTVYSTDDSNGRLIVKGTTGSTNTTSGALVVNGGVGISENLNVGGKITGSSGIKIIGGGSYGIDMYSGTGTENDNNTLKVDDNSVYISGNKGSLFVSGDVNFGKNLHVSENLSVGDEIFTETLEVADSINAGYIDSNYIDSKNANLENLEINNGVFEDKISSDDERIYIKNYTYESIKNLVNTYWDESEKTNNKSAIPKASKTGYSGVVCTVIDSWQSKSNKTTITCPKIYYSPTLTVTNNSNYKVEGCDISYDIRIYLEDTSDKSQIEILHTTGTRTNDGDTTKGNSTKYSWAPAIYSSATTKEVTVTKGRTYRLIVNCSIANYTIDISSLGAHNAYVSNSSYSIYSEDDAYCTISQTYNAAGLDRKTIIFNNGIITGSKKDACAGLLVTSGNIVNLFGTKTNGSSYSTKSVPITSILDLITGSWT